MPVRPLKGVRILSFEHLIALPFGMQILSDLGAEVTVIEPHWHRGDAGSRWRLRTGRFKRRIVVNLKDERGQALVHRMVKNFDVFAENYRPGVAKSYNLGYQTLRDMNPRLVYLSVSGFGQADFLPSPLEDLAAYGPIGEAMGGITDTIYGGVMTDSATGALALGDITTSLFATVGLLAALRHRDATGEGQYVDVAMADALLALNERAVVEHQRSGALKPEGVFFKRTFNAEHGRVMLIILHEGHWEVLCKLLDHPEWKEDERLYAFDRPDVRDVAVEEMVVASLEHWASGLTHIEASEALQKVGLAAAPVLTPPDILTSPHFEARDMLRNVIDEFGSCVTVVGNPIKLSLDRDPDGSHSLAGSAIAPPGEHTFEYLASELDLTAKELEHLSDEGVIGPVPDSGRAADTAGTQSE